MIRSIQTAILATSIAAAAISGCAVTSGQESAGQYASDTRITSEIKGKYGFDSGVSASAISVETLQGMVQLSGFASSAEEKAKAEEIAKAVKGVQGVRNNIIVRTPTR